MNLQQSLAVPEKLYQRVSVSIRRLMIAMYLITIGLAIVLTLVVGLNTQSILRNDANAFFVERITAGLSRVLEDIEALVDSPFARDYNTLIREQRSGGGTPNVRAFREAQITLLRQMNALIDRNPSTYLSISFLPREGFVWGEAINTRDAQVALATEERRALRGELSEAYSEMVASRRDRLTFSEIRVTPDGERFISIYAPVVDTVAPQLRGIIQFNVALEPFIQPIYLLDIDSPFAQQDRRLYVVAANGEILGSTNPAEDDAEIVAQLLTYPPQSSDILLGDSLFTVRSISLLDGAGMPWRVVLEDSLFMALRRSIIISLILVAAGALMWLMIYRRLARAIVHWIRPFSAATALAQELERVEPTDVQATFRRTAPSVDYKQFVTDDEIGTVVKSMSTASDRIRDLTRRVEREVQRRTRDIELASRIGREIAALDDIDKLLNRAIELIIRELGFYHAQVFLIDDAGINAVLVYSHGEAGRQLLAMNHQLPVGSRTVIGTVTRTGAPVIINDTQAGDVPHKVNALLPETRAEMGLPLVIGKSVIGALDIQSTRPNSFEEDDLPVFRLLADQLAIAINKARLLRQSSERYEQIQRLNRQMTIDSWRATDATANVASGYRYNLLDVQPLNGADTDDNGQGNRTVPIAIRGEPIGALTAIPGENHDLSEGDRMVLRAVSDRVALALDNARLFRETQNTLSETSVLYQLSRFLNEASTLEDVLQAMIVSTMQDAGGGQVWVFDAYIGEPDWVQIRADLAMSERPDIDDMDMTDYRLRVREYPFIAHLSPNQVTLISDASTDPRIDDKFRALFARMAGQSAVIIPLNMRGEWLGMVIVYFEEPRRFTPREERLYAALIDQAGIAIDNRLLFEQTEQTLSRNENLYAASRTINTAQTFGDLVRAAVVTSNDLRLSFGLALLEGDTDDRGWATTCRIVAESRQGTVEEVNVMQPIFISEDSPMHHREPEIIIENALENGGAPSQMPWLHNQGDLPFVALFPLFSGATPTAIFYITSRTPYVMGVEDNDAYRALTGQMSTQIENRRLLERTERTLEETLNLYRASRAISGARDTDTIYAQALDYIAMPLRDASAADPQTITAVLLVAKPNGDLESAQQWTSQPDIDSALAPGVFVTKGERIVKALVPSSENSVILPLLAEITEDEFAPLIAPLRADRAKSALIVPVRTSEYWIGTFVIYSTGTRLFNEQLARYVEAIASQTAISADNRRLFLQTQNDQLRLSQILSTLPAAVLSLDPQTFLPTIFNDKANEVLGEAVRSGLPFNAANYRLYRTSEPDAFYPDDELPVFVSLDENCPAFADDVTLYRRDGSVTHLMVNAATVSDENGKPLEIVVTFTDITNLRELETTLQENLREAIALSEARRQTSQASDLKDVLDALDVQLSLLQPSDTYVLLTDRNTGDLHIERSLIGAVDDPALLQDLLSAEQALYIPDTQRHNLPQSVRDKLDRHGVRAVVSAPLNTPGGRSRPLGWLVITSDQPNSFGDDTVRLLRQYGDIGATAIDNRYLIRSTREALEDTDKLYRLTKNINNSRNAEQLMDAIEAGLKTLQPDGYLVFVTNEEVFETTVLERGGGFETLRAALVRYGIDGDSLYIDDATSYKPTNQAERELKIALGDWQSVAILNLRIKDMPYGRLVVAYSYPHPFTDSDRRYLEALVDSASVVLDNFALVQETQANLIETTMLYESVRRLTEATSNEEILDVVVNHVVQPHVDLVFVALVPGGDWSAPGAVVEIVASWSAASTLELKGAIFTTEQLPVWRFMASRTLWHSPDITRDDRISELERESFESLDARSVVIIPLRVPNRVIGAIWIGSRKPYTYNERQLRSYQSFGEQASLSMEASYLLEQTDRRARQLETSAQVSNRAGTILEINELLPQLVNLIRDSFGYDHVQIFLMDENHEYAELRASTGEAGRRLLAIKHKLKRGSQSVIGQVTERQEPVIALDTFSTNVVHKPNPLLPLTRSEMALPLMIKGELIGALDVQSNQPNAFNADDVNALTTLAAQISIAIENANLYRRAQDQADRMSLLFNITTAAAFAPTLTNLLESVADQLHTNNNALNVALYLKRDYISRHDEPYSRMVPVSIAGEGTIETAPAPRLDDEEDLIAYVARRMQPLIVDNVSQEARYTPISPDAQSVLLTPLIYNNEPIGLIIMESAQAHAYTYQEMQLLMTLSGTLSSIVQSAQLVEQLQDANEELKELDRIKSDFLANMSHELRTPLNSIIGFSRVMLKGIDGPLTEMQEQDLTTIYNSGNHLLALINDILDQAKIAAGKMDIKSAFFDIKSVIDVVKSMAIGYMKDKPLKLYVDLAPSLPKVYADEIRLRQVLINLVSNAIKFTDEGSVSIRVYPVSDDAGETFVRVDVIDTGIGIAESDMPLLFEAFQQLDSSLTRTHGGTGLGLPIAKSLMEMQGGQLLVESELHVGSTFSVLIPTVAQEQPHDQPAEDDTPVNTAEPITQSRNGKQTQETRTVPRVEIPPQFQQKRQILLIEDDADMVAQFRRALQREGFEVLVASVLLEAEAMASGLHPTLIIMDVNFANGAGWDVLRNLKDRDDTFDIPIIVVSLSTESERAYQLGAHTFIPRPFLPEDLVKAALEAEKESNTERILIIDDQPNDIRLLAQLLDEHGNYRVFHADNGRDGIALVARRRPDLVILDLRMPGMDGFAVLQELRNNPETSAIPVMIVTGDLSLNADEQAILENVRVLQKTDISQSEYNDFITRVQSHLSGKSG